MNIGSLLEKLTLEHGAQIATIALGVLGVLGAWASWRALYWNFLRPPKLSVKIGKSALIVFHDNTLELAPMIDVFCTLVNEGARAKTVDKLVVHLAHKENTQKIGFDDYGFLKMQCAFSEAGPEHKWVDAWVPYEYSHPLVVSKYSEVSRMVMFKGRDAQYGFDKGSYELTIEAQSDGMRVGVDRITFDITAAKAEAIRTKQNRKKNDATEIPLK